LKDPSTCERAIAVGDRFGRFEILGAIGSGGMGEVYRARDPQLSRDVAIKVLPTAFADDPDRRRRFEQEARAAALTNHPNVVSVYDAGVHDGRGFIVTELLEGETLREHMCGRALPMRRAVAYAAQVAAGLAAGHERGIVHLDVKPENLFVTKSGAIKILDFGIAKMLGAEGRDGETGTVSPDGGAAAPMRGTAAYMSPEQARGVRVDHRGDLFSLGVVLYEMLTGVAPFRRPTTVDTLAAIVREDPPALGAVAAASPALERIVRHCLEKAAEQRYQNASDLQFDLDLLSSLAVDPGAAAQHRRIRRPLLAAGCLALSTAAALSYLAGRWTSPEDAPTAPHTARRLTDLPGLEQSPAISPDGRSVAFAANVGGHRQIFVRLAAGGAPLQITRDAADHDFPRWWPDGSALVYFSPADAGEALGALWMIPALGGPRRRLGDSISDADVSRDGRLAFFRLEGRRVQLVTSSLASNDVRVLAESAAGYHRYPRWSPDGRWVAFQRGDGLRFDIFVVAAAGGEPRRLTADRNIISGLAWRPDGGALIYGSSRASTIPYLPPETLWEVPFRGGTPRQITATDVWYEEPDVDAAGVVATARLQMHFDIWRFPFGDDPAANVRDAERLTRQNAQVSTPTAAPSGEIAFLSDSGGHANLWVLAPGTGDLRQITFEQDPAVAVGLPVWSPDGRSIAFVSSKGRTGFDFGVWVVDPDGANLRNVAAYGLGPAWSPDGRWLYFAETSAGVLNKVAASGGAPVRVRDGPTRNVIGVHAETLYYMVEDPLLDGRPEFEIRAATPEGGVSRTLARIPAARVPRWQVANPALSPDGRWLAVPLTAGLTTDIWVLSTSTADWRRVTDFGDRPIFIARHVSWSPDGRSLLAAVGEGDADIVLLDGLIEDR
jgi:serine/threonine protein kinase/Tol biopolymer transport system component